MALSIARSTRVCLEGQLQDRLQQQGFKYPVNEISFLVCQYLLPGLSDLFSELYSLNFSLSIASLEQANVFLLGEVHDDQSSWRKLNGRFITYLSQFYPLTVFVEGFPLMKIPDVNMQQKIKRVYQINSDLPINFYGWDFNTPLAQELNRKLMLIKQLKCERAEVNKEISLWKDLQELRVLSQKKSKLGVEYHTVSASLTALIQETFPARTQAMVSTLQAIRRGEVASSTTQTKYVFFAGWEHFQEQNLQRKEFSLEPLRKELLHQKAVIMIPAIDDLTV